MAKKKASGGKPLALSFCDATKAYFNAVPQRDIFVRAPKELGLPPNTVGKLVRCAYGTRDAGALWEEHYASVLVGMGFVRGRASPTCFYHPQRHIAVVVHGDDFVALANDDQLSWYEENLRKAFELGECSRLGLGPQHVREIRILNRILRIDSSGLKWEADPRHLELLAKSLGLEKCRGRATPGDKSKDFDPTEADDSDGDIHSNSNSTQPNQPTPQPVNSIHAARRKNKRGVTQQIKFDMNPEIVNLHRPYRDIWCPPIKNYLYWLGGRSRGCSRTC